MRCPREGTAGTQVGREAAFGTVYCLKHAPWQFYYEVHKATRNMQMPLVLMQARFDGKLGFFGGLVEEDETVETTLQRELREELNCSDVTGFEYLCSHEVPADDMRTHFFVKEVSEEAFFQIEADACKAQHFGSEVLGYIRAPLFVNESDQAGADPSGLPNFLRSCFHKGVIEELVYLLAARKLLALPKLEKAVTSAGLDFQALLPDDIAAAEAKRRADKALEDA